MTIDKKLAIQSILATIDIIENLIANLSPFSGKDKYELFAYTKGLREARGALLAAIPLKMKSHAQLTSEERYKIYGKSAIMKAQEVAAEVETPVIQLNQDAIGNG